MENRKYNIVIIGGGLSGLAAAVAAEESGHRTLLVEASDSLGGRVKTDKVDGFLLDHGFQVLLSSYKKAAEMFDLEALKLGRFGPGAYITDEKGSFVISDPLRDFSKLIPMAFSRVGSIGDKLKIWKLTRSLASMSDAEIFKGDLTTLEYLRKLDFSENIIQNFFVPFFGGVFLERKLETPAAMFRFVFDAFAKGDACLPANGMQELGQQLARKLKSTDIRLSTRVKSLTTQGIITLDDGEEIEAKKVIVACDPGAILPQMDRKLQYRHTTTMYFAGDLKLKKMNKLIGLDARRDSPINNYARHDEISTSYAPEGKSLWSVTVRDGVKGLKASVQAALAELIGCQAEDLSFLKDYMISKALPMVPNPQLDVPAEQMQLTENVYLAGDYLLNASIDGALRSGLRTAEAVTETLDLV